MTSPGLARGRAWFASGSVGRCGWLGGLRIGGVRLACFGEWGLIWFLLLVSGISGSSLSEDPRR